MERSDVTIFDVARKAGVSIATVSRVLNASGRVDSATRRRVMAAIHDLGFTPNVHAADRARKGTHRIGVAVPSLDYPGLLELLRGIVSALADPSYEPVLYNLNTPERRDTYLSTLPVTRRIDGVIVIAVPQIEAHLQRWLEHDLPAVLVNISHPSLSSVEVDEEAGGRLAGEHLVSRGHTRCAFLGDERSVPPHQERRLAGFRQALSRAGIPLPGEYIALSRSGPGQAREQIHHLLALADPPTALFAASDEQAMGALGVVCEHELRIPDAVAMIGFGDSDAARTIGLTTVRLPLEDAGRTAVNLLLARLGEQPGPVQRILLAPTVSVRRTA